MALISLSSGASAADSSSQVTFNKDIAPLVFSLCAHCHRPGEVAPFSLLSYHDVSKRAEQILDLVERGTMPPWRPKTGYGEFGNGRRLTPAEIDTVRQWVKGGAVEGRAVDLPKPPKFSSDWHLGKPDLIVTMPEPFTVPAEGRDVYLNVVLPFNVPEGKYIKAAEFRPGNRRVVHHAVLFYDTSGKARKLDDENHSMGFLAGTPPGQFLPGTLSIWTPGRFSAPLSEGLSMPWPKNADLVLNLHLHPSGKSETEQSTVGFYFTDEPPRRSLVDVTLIDRKIDIAPGDKGFRTKDSCTLPIDLDALSIFPHMHMIGKEIKLTAEYPDGKTQVLFWIDDWNFNWQDLYQYAQPVHLPKGTKLTFEGVHDNSADNPFNPRTPPVRVRWGEQTFDEMSIVFLNLAPTRESDLIGASAQRGDRMRLSIRGGTAIANAGNPSAPSRTPPSAEQLASQAAEALNKFDADKNGKLDLNEILTATGNKQPAAEIEKQITLFDRDGDKQLNPAEVAEALKAIAQRRAAK